MFHGSVLEFLHYSAPRGAVVPFRLLLRGQLAAERDEHPQASLSLSQVRGISLGPASGQAHTVPGLPGDLSGSCGRSGTVASAQGATRLFGQKVSSGKPRKSIHRSLEEWPESPHAR